MSYTLPSMMVHLRPRLAPSAKIAFVAGVAITDLYEMHHVITDRILTRIDRARGRYDGTTTSANNTCDQQTVKKTLRLIGWTYGRRICVRIGLCVYVSALTLVSDWPKLLVTFCHVTEAARFLCLCLLSWLLPSMPAFDTIISSCISSTTMF